MPRSLINRFRWPRSAFCLVKTKGDFDRLRRLYRAGDVVGTQGRSAAAPETLESKFQISASCGSVSCCAGPDPYDVFARRVLGRNRKSLDRHDIVAAAHPSWDGQVCAFIEVREAEVILVVLNKFREIAE